MKNELTLSELEQEIDDGIKAFVRLGRALINICDRNLYRDVGYKNLESYTLSRWGHRRSWAYQLMEAARIYGYLEDAGFPKEQLPTSESPLRVMATRSPEECVEIWKQALERSPRPTRGLISDLLESTE